MVLILAFGIRICSATEDRTSRNPFRIDLFWFRTSILRVFFGRQWGRKTEYSWTWKKLSNIFIRVFWALHFLLEIRVRLRSQIRTLLVALFSTWYIDTNRHLGFVWAAQYWDYLPNFMERKSFKSKGRCKKRWTVLRPNIWRNKEIISIKCEHVLKIALPFAMYNTVKWLILLESSLTLNQYMPMPIHMRCCCSSHMPKIVRTMFTFIISLFGFFHSARNNLKIITCLLIRWLHVRRKRSVSFSTS